MVLELGNETVVVRRSLLSTVAAILEIVDDAQGVITPEVEAQIDGLGCNFEDRCEATAMVIRRLEAEADMNRRAAKAEAEHYTTRANARQKSADRLKQRVQSAMSALGKQSVRCATATIWRQASERVEVANTPGFLESYRGTEYVRTTEEPCLSAVKRDLKAGVELAHVELVRGEHLRIG